MSGNERDGNTKRMMGGTFIFFIMQVRIIFFCILIMLNIWIVLIASLMK